MQLEIPFGKIQKTEQDKTVEKAHTIITELSVKAERLVHQDISAWRWAHQVAMDVDNPKRIQLYNLYDFTTSIDSYVAGVVERTKEGVLQRKYKLADKSGKRNDAVTALFETPWFIEFMSLAYEAENYGHSLIQFGDIITHNGMPAFSGVSLVPRRHICPEYGVILRDQADTPDRGIPYRTGPYSRWTIEAGKPQDLGRFLKITQHVISKKHVQIFWDNFAERFGIPLIYATTETRNVADRVKIENMLSTFGNNSWAFFPLGTTLNLLETSKGDAFEVFDRRIIRANNEISIGLAGQTMSFSDGSSRSQAEVHERGYDEIKNAISIRLQFLVNYRLIPFMKMHGFPIGDCTFMWDDSYDLSPAEIREVERMLLQYYTVDPKYFEEQYNIPITGDRTDFFG